MSQSGNDNGEYFKIAAEDKGDTSYSTVDDKNELPKYLTDGPATRDCLAGFHVEQESLEKGPGCILDLEYKDVIYTNT
eukprot:12276075-Ditylum_brightwellii.AAC.1